jgi:superfamily II DNA/RNA helicase
MTSQQTELYKGLLKSDPVISYKIRNNLPPSKAESLRLNSFMNGVRQVSNNPASYSSAFKGDPYQHSPKMQRMVAEIKKRHEANPNFRGLIYSNYLDSGIKPLAAQLSREGISNAMFSGELNDTDRKKLVQAYNEGKIKALLISGAGAEGLDLKGTRLVQVMEPHWNLSRINQVIGRAVRHKSHSHLPENERNVEIQRFYSKPTPSFFERLGFASEDTGADRYLHGLAVKKQKLIDDLLQVLQQSGSSPASTVTSRT